MLAQYFQLVRVPDADCRWGAIRPGNQPFMGQLLVLLSHNTTVRDRSESDFS